MRNVEAEIKYIFQGDGSTETSVEGRLRIVLDNMHDSIDFFTERRNHLHEQLTKVKAVLEGEL